MSLRNLRVADLWPPRRIGAIIPELAKCGGDRLLDPRTATRRHTTLRARPLQPWMRFGSCLSGSDSQVDPGGRRSRESVIAAPNILGFVAKPGAKHCAASERTGTILHMKIGRGVSVRIEYELKIKGGEVIESSARSGPLQYVQGAGKMLPGLEKRLDGLSAGDERSGTIPAAEAFGTEEALPLKKMTRKEFPEGIS